jgi:outer membrane translocation and assembly module TamA
MLSPTRGSLHDVTIEAAGPWMGGNRTYARLNASFRTYVPFKAPSFVMAFRILVDAAWGDVPLTTLGEFGGVAPTEGIGGDTSGRGFFRRRFVGPSKLLAGPEFRWRVLELGIRRRRVQLGLVAFSDVGKIFQRHRQFSEDLHVGVGTGFYIALPPTLVLRVEAAIGTEGPAAFLTTGHAF